MRMIIYENDDLWYLWKVWKDVPVYAASMQCGHLAKTFSMSCGNSILCVEIQGKLNDIV